MANNSIYEDSIRIGRWTIYTDLYTDTGKKLISIKWVAKKRYSHKQFAPAPAKFGYFDTRQETIDFLVKNRYLTKEQVLKALIVE